ncbi:MAG: CFI-box-CTERM domain-containing protein [Flavobacterium sp.]
MPQYLLDLGLARVEKYSDNEKNTWRYPKLEIKPEKKSGCFIATATMGSYDHPMVMELRGFRDNWILQKSWGEGFVKWYYHYGAIIAKVIEKSFILKKLSYLFIVKPLVCMSKIIKYLNH